MQTLDHIGIAVPEINAALDLYTNSFGFKLGSRETVPSQEVEIAFVALSNTKIELLAPTSPTSTLATFLNKRGPGLHHICYAVQNISAELARYKALGFTLIDETPRPGAHNTLIAFIHPKSCGGVLMEICEHR